MLCASSRLKPSSAWRPSGSAQVDAAETVEGGLMTVKGAVEFLCVSRSWLYGAMDRGELAYVRLGRARRIPKRALIELAARHLRNDGAIARVAR
jgi:excisionase family DNA binding protein